VARIATVWLGFAIRRHRLALDPGELIITRFAGMAAAMARDAWGKVLCRHLERKTARLMAMFCEIQAGMDRSQRA
jgi:hypothetical protein